MNSFAFKFRKKRLKFFEEFTSQCDGLHILDVGGLPSFWDKLDFSKEKESRIVLLNLEPMAMDSHNITCQVGDATNMPEFDDSSFDIVFSNSVIEHVGDFQKQKCMANEVIRIGKSYFVQTPNKYFPIEPHFLFPYFQLLPQPIRVFLLMHYNLGWYSKQTNKEEANIISNSIRLLSKQDIQTLFPNADIFEEKFLFLTKSYIAYSYRKVE